MTPEEHVNWFYEKFKDGLEGHHAIENIIRERFDQEKILDLIEKYDCSSVLEIGTWEGQTGMLIWLYPKVKKFIAIDIHKDMGVYYYSKVHTLSDKKFIGHYLADTHTKIDFIDTMKWKPRKWKKENGQIDLVFIDANHDVEHVRNDTLKALQLKPKIIVWHDVCHDVGGDHVPTFLEEFNITHPQYTINIIPNTEIGFIVMEEAKK